NALMIRFMDWTSIIQDLIDSGLTQAQIAKLALTGQSHISGLYRKERLNPSWPLGDRILSLHKSRCKDEKEAA
ncbi:MAG TPA: hypothetical protein PKD04_10575, partial [Rhodocyclaceae bacterium]|nr:hypothetical protein [Rhodocyclaceae bacterium]